MNFLFKLFILLGLPTILYACANAGAPIEGGTKDMAYPELLKSVPENFTTHFSAPEVLLIFNERIAPEKIAESFFILPRQELQPSITFKSKSLSIHFNDTLKPNTTYTLIFKEGIKDVTENNTIPYLSYTFSTGNYLDSLSIAGNVRFLKTNKPAENALIALYPSSDTLNVTKHKPTYFGYADEQGNYLLNNLKNGLYDLYVINDKNKNLLYDSKTEAISFKKKLNISEKIKDLNFKISKIDTIKPRIEKIVAETETSKIFFSKGIKKIKAETLKKDSIPTEIMESGKIVLLFNALNIYDSLKVHITAIDTANNVLKDTCKILFKKADSTNKLKPLIKTISPLNRLLDISNPEISIDFNYPLTKVNKPLYLKQEQQTTDLPVPQKKGAFSLSIKIPVTVKDTVTVIIPENTFGSYFSLQNKADTIQFISIEREDVGLIRGTVNTTADKYILQLLSEDYKVIDAKYTPKSFVFDNLKPGSYFLRVIIDKNGNGTWDQASVENNTEAEPIIFHKNPIKVKANWEITGINIKI